MMAVKKVAVYFLRFCEVTECCLDIGNCGTSGHLCRARPRYDLIKRWYWIEGMGASLFDLP